MVVVPTSLRASRRGLEHPPAVKISDANLSRHLWCFCKIGKNRKSELDRANVNPSRSFVRVRHYGVDFVCKLS